MAEQKSKKSGDARVRSVFIGVCTTGLSLIPTGYAALIANSATLIADFLRCSAEFIAIFLSWMVLRKISSADRSKYNFGFSKLEQLAGLGVAVALLFTFSLALVSTVFKVISPEPLVNVEFGFWLAVASIAGNGYLWGTNYRLSQSISSPVIDAQWRLFRAKTFAVTVVALSLGGSMLFGSAGWALYFDPFGSFVLAVFLLWSAYVIVSNSMSDLVDRAVEERVQLIIVSALIRHEAEYQGLSEIRTRRSGPRIYVDLFLSFDRDAPLSAVHRSCMIIKNDLKDQLPNGEILVIAAPERDR